MVGADCSEHHIIMPLSFLIWKRVGDYHSEVLTRTQCQAGQHTVLICGSSRNSSLGDVTSGVFGFCVCGVCLVCLFFLLIVYEYAI